MNAPAKRAGNLICPQCDSLVKAGRCTACNWEDRVEPERGQENKTAHDCAAWGCPLPGSIRAGDKWFCSWHNRNPVSLSDRVSTWARKHKRLIIAKRRLTNIGPLVFGIERKRWESSSIPPNPGETYRDYLQRLDVAIRDSFSSEVVKPSKEGS